MKKNAILPIIFLLIFTNVHAQTKEPDSLIFTKVEIEASFPGGNQAWIKYLQEAISAESGKFKKSDYGTCIIRFMVDVDGEVSQVEATNMKKSRLAKITIRAIKDGPGWTPAMRDGKPLRAFRLQPVTVSDPNKGQ